MDESRKQFECFLLSKSHGDLCENYLLDKDEYGCYKLPRTNDRWVFWQAARQGLQDQQLARSEKVREMLSQRKLGDR